MKNADLFKDTFGTYATEIWSMPERDFLKWLNEDVKPKTGHWIDSPNGYFTHCSECGLYGDKGIYKHYGWCPKCGAKMIELQESESDA